MDELKVETGIPLPVDGKGRPRVYPWGKMNVGDCFLIECKHTNIKKLNTAKSAAFVYGKRHQMKFATRKVPEGLRIWRVE